MLRLAPFELHQPRTSAEALALLVEHGDQARIIAGGTDLLPNLKHGLYEPRHLISLASIEELRGVREEAGGFVIGAMTPLAEVAAHPGLPPALTQAAGLVAGPQLRSMGTLGGNVLLDTRCQWYNQTYFWRKALGFCLKKDGTLCHVVQGGRRCVAAASNDTAPALMGLGASLTILAPQGPRTLPIEELYRADGTRNVTLGPDELLLAVHLPPLPAGHRGAYGKLRERGSIDFPQLGMAARIDLNGEGSIEAADLCAVALAARPLRLKGTSELLSGTRPGEEACEQAIEEVAALAYRRFKPQENIPGDAAYRREMVPVLARRTLRAALTESGPVQWL